MARRVFRGWCLLALLIVPTACKETGTIQVHTLRFKGVHAVSASDLANALATRESSRLPWGKKKFFDRSRFDADLMRLRSFYANRGYPDARITAFDVKLNNKQDAVDITVTISEGTPVLVAAVNFSGFDVVPAAHFRTMLAAVPVKVGRPRDRQQVDATSLLAVNELRDHGYPYAKVSIEEQGGKGKDASLTFRAEPGPLARFGAVEVVGNQSVGNRVIERELAYKPGELYQRSLLLDTQRRLYGMDLFQFVAVEPIEVDQQPAEVPTRVSIAESPHQRINFGVGYGTEENARVDAEYHHLNFLGGARSAGAHVRWSSLDRGVRLDLRQPYLFTPNFSLAVEGQDWYAFTPAYRTVTVGGKATLTHRRTAATYWSVSLTNEQDTSSIAPAVQSDATLRNDLIALGLDPSTDMQHGTLSAIGFEMQHSTADNVLNARRGYQVGFHAEEAGLITPGTFNYRAVSAEARHYLPISTSLVWANRVQIASIDPQGGNPANVPFSKKYFLGGATSIRGWGRYEVSPLSDSGLPVGGDSMLLFSSELRTGLAGNLSGVLFLDGGDVWPGAWGFRLNDLNYAVGPGLRYQTPIGPVRFDLGYQLTRIPNLQINGGPETRRWRIHFSIGQAF